MPALLHAAHAPMFSSGQPKTNSKKGYTQTVLPACACLLLVLALCLPTYYKPVVCMEHHKVRYEVQ